MQKIINKIFQNVVLYKNEIVYKGIGYFIHARIQKIIDYFVFRYFEMFLSHRRFTFQKRQYIYFYHRYNVTWKNERSVEIPLVYSIVKTFTSKKILEVGNVLSHYFDTSHDVLDKYEQGNKIYNQDVTTFQTKKKYNLIVSISTLEHVGWDEKPRERMKFLKAIKHLKTFLTPNGILLFTVPLKYNKDIDFLLMTNRLRPIKKYFLKRISQDNRWVEVPWEKVKNVHYNKKYPHAEGIMVGIIQC